VPPNPEILRFAQDDKTAFCKRLKYVSLIMFGLDLGGIIGIIPYRGGLEYPRAKKRLSDPPPVAGGAWNS
jgi:hypothetical protein